MTHLEERVTALVDGRLTPDATERALVHLAECARCRVAVAAERATRRALREAPDPAPSSELLSRLLAMGGPAGPLAPRPGHVPGAPRPVPLPPPGAPWLTRPPGRTDGVRSRRRRALRSAALGVVSVASLGLVGLLLVGTVASRQEPVALGTASLVPGVQPAAGSPPGTVDRLDDAELAALRDDGWPCPESLAGGLPLVDAHSIDTGDVPVLHLRYSDGRATVSVVEQRGELDAAQATAFSQAIRAGTAGRRDVPWHAIWQSGDVVVAVVAEGPPQVLSKAVETLPPAGPVDDPDVGWWDRVGRGADVVAALLSGS